MTKYYVTLVIPVLAMVEANNPVHAEVKAQQLIEDGIASNAPLRFFNGHVPVRSMVTDIREITAADSLLDLDDWEDDIYE